MKTITKVGLIGAITGAVGYYFYGSEDAKKNRTAAMSWMKKAEKEVEERISELADEALNKKNYQKIAEEVGEKYRLLHKLSSRDVIKFVNIISDAWEDLKDQAEDTVDDVKKGIRGRR